MKIYRISLNEAGTALDSYLRNGEMTELYSDVYRSLRRAITQKSRELKELYLDQNRKYQFDVELGLFLFELFWKQDGFYFGLGSDPDFWRYLTVCTAPEPVFWRWKTTRERYLTKTRNYYRTLWWYVYLSWQGSVEATRQVLLSPNFSTDTILNLVDRSGKKGFCLDVTRSLMNLFSILPSEMMTLPERDFFRTVMVLNTARMVVIDPTLTEDGAGGYVLSLLEDSGISREDLLKVLGGSNEGRDY